MRIAPRFLVPGAAAIALVLAAGCGTDGPTTTPPPSQTTSDSPTTTGPPSQSPTTPAWTKNYSASQLDQYRQALATWNAYQRDSAPIWATGRVTPKAQRIFERYWYSPKSMVNRLRTAQEVGAHDFGGSKVISSRPALVRPGVVRIHQCVDASHATIRISGKIQPRRQQPFRRVIAVDRSAGKPWRVLLVKDPSVGWVKRCAH